MTPTLNIGPCKHFLSYSDQLQLLESRGLIVNNRTKALDILKNTNYYRFTAYTLTLKKNDTFYPGVTFDQVYQLYQFDDALRKVMLKYLSYIEISFRSFAAYYMAQKHGPLCYMYSSFFKDPYLHAQLISEVEIDVKRSDDLFVIHHKTKYNNVFPIWVVTEVMSFGVLSKMFKNMLPSDKNALSKQFFNRSAYYVSNWLHCCVYCRNIAAHGGRFYNRKLKSVPVQLPPKYSSVFDNTKCFAFLFAMTGLLPDPKLKEKLIQDITSLFGTFPFVQHKHLGFPGDWKKILRSQ